MESETPLSLSQVTRRWLLVGSFAVAAALAAWLAHGARRGSAAPSPAVSGQNLLGGVAARDGVGPALEQLGWDDIAATAAGTSARAGLRREAVDALAGHQRAAARYLRGLLLMAEQRPDEALAVFDSIPVDQIPVLHLYAPYRLHGTLRPGAPNRYRAPLVAARRAGQLPPLTAGRVAVGEGDLRAAVQGYVTSDPAQWAQHDLNAFRAMMLHAGLSPDTRTMLAAALRGGRVPARLRADVEALLSSTDGSRVPDQLKAGLTKLFAENPAAREVAIAAAAEQLRVRRLFLARQYAVVVQEHRASDPTSLPDATLVILLVSAGRSGEIDLRDLWAQELRRRHPGPDFERWFAAVRAEHS